MNIAFYNAVSGMVAHQSNLDVISHNIANVNTGGFKPMRSSFSDLLYTQMNTKVEGEFLNGHGTKVQATDLIFEQGMLNRTENELDFAIVGDGFFAVDRGGETLEYTRNGAFSVGYERSRSYLVTLDGGYVLDARGKRIDLGAENESNVLDYSGIKEEIGIYTVPNPYGLRPVNSSSFIETEISGPAEAVDAGDDELPYDLISGALEFSKVDLSHEMVNVLQAQRAFQFNARLVQTADQIEEIINNLR